MSLARPASGSAAWDGPLNDNFSTVDLHDHSSGKGVRVPTSGLNINANLPFGSNRATGLRALVFSGATSESAVQDYSIYTSSGNLYYKKAGFTAVQITSDGGLNGVASTKGFGTGYDNTSTAVAAFDSGNAHFVFRSTADDGTANLTNLARTVAHQHRAYGTTAGIIIDSTSASSNFRIGTAANGGNLVISAGATVYTGHLTTTPNILEVSPGGNVGVGTAGTGTSDRFNVYREVSSTNAVQNIVNYAASSTGTTASGFGGRMVLRLKLGAGAVTEVNRIDWRLDGTTQSHFRFSAYESSALAEALRLGARNSPVEINMAATEAIKLPASTNIVAASASSCSIGSPGTPFASVSADNVFAGSISAGLQAPASATALATRHGYNCILAWGQIDSTGAAAATHYNIASSSKTATGTYEVVLDTAVNTASVILVTAEDTARMVRCNWTDTTHITVGIKNDAGTDTDSDFHFLIVGRPSGTP